MKLHRDSLKIIFSTIIIACAACIMLPQILGLAVGITRMIILIGVTVVLSVVLAFFWRHLTKSR